MNKYNIVDEKWYPTKQNVTKLVDQLKNSEDIEIYDPFDEGEEFEIGNGWIYALEERFGGYEGCGEEHWVVFSIKKEGEPPTYWQIAGYYQSYHGAELDGKPYQVQQEPQMILVWKKISKK